MGREIQPIKITGEDRRTYRAKLARSLDVFARMLRENLFESDPCLVGQEIELNLVDDDGAPSMRNGDVLAEIADPAWATEVGQFNLEINVPPRELTGDAVVGLEEEIRQSLNHGDGRARGLGSRLVMIGILPTLRKSDVTADTMSANERFRVLNEQIFAARGEDMQIEIEGAEQLLTHSDSITPRPRAPASSCTCRSARRPLPRTGTPLRPCQACRSRWPPTRRSCSGGSCGTRPGSRCSSRPPTPGPMS